MAIASVFCGVLSACTALYDAPDPREEVEVDVVIAQLKCELARYLTNSDITTGDKLGVKGGKAEITLGLNVVVTDTVDASLKAPKLFVFHTGTAGPSVSGSLAVKRTVNTSMKFTVEGGATNTKACEYVKNVKGEIGLYTFLSTRSNQLRQMPVYEPKARMNELKYESLFAVTKNVKAGGGTELVFVRLGAEANYTNVRDDVQSISVVIKSTGDIEWMLPG
ncbi:hypothetical protein [Mycoplana rhizolycopersici]|uniref:Uncharacterized protein n=1 Tax=Mycoplana rhizolycopersici TaxID=2746702 RepID=A0ABX2QEA3_9HYPH|nr:hypothetical protein [Rhizobium rhizolycopersici]NVP56060.1 hypothetical protein [Rhizobium rhizolycopersici]